MEDVKPQICEFGREEGGRNSALNIFCRFIILSFLCPHHHCLSPTLSVFLFLPSEFFCVFFLPHAVVFGTYAPIYFAVFCTFTPLFVWFQMTHCSVVVDCRTYHTHLHPPANSVCFCTAPSKTRLLRPSSQKTRSTTWSGRLYQKKSKNYTLSRVTRSDTMRPSHICWKRNTQHMEPYYIEECFWKQREDYMEYFTFYGIAHLFGLHLIFFHSTWKSINGKYENKHIMSVLGIHWTAWIFGKWKWSWVS